MVLLPAAVRSPVIATVLFWHRSFVDTVSIQELLQTTVCVHPISCILSLLVLFFTNSLLVTLNQIFFNSLLLFYLLEGRNMIKKLKWPVKNTSLSCSSWFHGKLDDQHLKNFADSREHIEHHKINGSA